MIDPGMPAGVARGSAEHIRLINEATGGAWQLWVTDCLLHLDVWKVEAAPFDALGKHGPKYGEQTVQLWGLAFQVVADLRRENTDRLWSRGWHPASAAERAQWEAGSPDPPRRDINGEWLRRAW